MWCFEVVCGLVGACNAIHRCKAELNTQLAAKCRLAHLCVSTRLNAGRARMTSWLSLVRLHPSSTSILLNEESFFESTSLACDLVTSALFYVSATSYIQ